MGFVRRQRIGWGGGWRTLLPVREISSHMISEVGWVTCAWPISPVSAWGRCFYVGLPVLGELGFTLGGFNLPKARTGLSQGSGSLQLEFCNFQPIQHCVFSRIVSIDCVCPFLWHGVQSQSVRAANHDSSLLWVLNAQERRYTFSDRCLCMAYPEPYLYRFLCRLSSLSF